MRVRKIHWRLGVLALATALSTMVLPAGAATGALPADAVGDIIDITKHPQNSFRPGNPGLYSSYQTSCFDQVPGGTCQNVLDIRNVSVSTDTTNKRITFTMTLGHSLPPRGSPVTALPGAPIPNPAGGPALGQFPMSDMAWSFYFATSNQDARQHVGLDCNPLEYNPLGQVDSTQRVYVAKWGTRSGQTCPQARIIAGTKTTETEGISNGSRVVLDTDVIWEPPHAQADGWMGVVSISAKPELHGSRGGPLNTPLNCIGGAPQCIDYNMQIGYHEGYSGFTVSNDKRDFINESLMSFTISGSTITATVPYTPQQRSSVDDDMLIDDVTVWPWPFGVTGGKMTHLVGQSSGTVEAGSPVALCPFGPDFSPEETLIPPVGYPQNLPFADGGNDCIRGVYGLLTLLDWNDNGFQLRQVPRSPAYAPSVNPATNDDSLHCRYPVGQRPAPPASASVGPMDPVTIDASTNPLDKNWQVGVFSEGVAGNPNTGTTVGAAPNPAPNPIDPGLGLGKDKPCKYTNVPTGLHYFDILSTDVPM